MKIAIAAAIALAALSSVANSAEKPADAEPWEGKFSNGSVTITRSVGPKGGDEFVSSACKKQVITPRMAPNGTLVGPKNDFAIDSAENYAKLVVTGTHKCLPAGTYARVG